MNKARVLSKYSRYLRAIAAIERSELPALERRLACARRGLARLDRLTFVSQSLVDRLRREAEISVDRRSRLHRSR